jgi:polyisoprenoid-binding protein YceI
MKNWISLILLVLVWNTHTAQTPKIATSLSVSFGIKNLGVTVDGYFKKGSAKIFFDTTQLTSSTFEGIMEANSISTGIQLRDKHLKDKEEFFDVKKYSAVRMKSVKIERSETGVYRVTWELTMKDVTSKVVSLVYISYKEGQQQFKTKFAINRRDWHIGGKSLTMSDQVTIQINAVMK